VINTNERFTVKTGTCILAHELSIYRISVAKASLFLLLVSTTLSNVCGYNSYKEQ
jgi:hypothetical protein